MRQKSCRGFLSGPHRKKKQRRPLKGQLELTYRCSFRCPYCYLRPQQKIDYYRKELPFGFWRDLLDTLYNEECLDLTFTGGDPLLRKDFLDIYLYAKRKGFTISIFTNALSLEADIVQTLKEYFPYAIELTLNSLKEERFNAITATRGNFKRSIYNIRRAAKTGLPVILKSNGLRLNKDEISQIRAFAGELLGEKRYKFDSYILPGLNGDRRPLSYRLTPEEIVAIEESDPDIREFLEGAHRSPFSYKPDRELLYKCNTWLTNFFVDPYGILRFCRFTDKYSTDLKKSPFPEGFYRVFSRLSKESYKTNTACKYCKLARLCLSCPSRNFLETGNEEKPVEYFCLLAKEKAAQKKRIMAKR